MTRKILTRSATRYRQLDGLRGVAALAVVFNHYAQAVPESIRLSGHFSDVADPRKWLSIWTWLRFTPFRLAIDGEVAVVVFFVLSGFVLTLPVSHLFQPKLSIFWIKRLCRVYLPFAIVIMLIAAAWAVVPIASHVRTSRWFDHLVPTPGNYSVARHLLMTGTQRDTVLDRPMWTLVHEMRMAIVLPIIFLSIRKLGGWKTLTIALFSSVIVSTKMIDSVSGGWLATIHFAWMFVAGAIVSFNRGAISQWISKLGRVKRTGLLVLASVLMMIPFDRVWSDFFIGAGATLLVCLLLVPGLLTTTLSSRLPQWLGRISYSLYLLHLPILVLLVSSGAILGPSLAPLVITFLLADIAYRIIEAPSHHLGILLSKRVTLLWESDVSNGGRPSLP